MKLLIIRHADPDYEHNCLTEQGTKEARLLSEYLRNVPIDAAYTSPLARARLTAAPVLSAHDMTAQVCDWLREFDAQITKPNQDAPGIVWDWLPADWTAVPDFYAPDTWTRPAVMRTDVTEKYRAVCDGLDELLNRHGYRRDGRLYRVTRANHDTIALFCHFGVECVLLSHLLSVSPMPLWHSFCALPSSVTLLYTEERREGIASFRVSAFGDLSHLHQAGVEASFSARFCECFSDNTRHD
ncbi:MAG: histidine phosphatase family protein [Oscillospiraceae bacterium]|nr:histidine phosphatase family protein [Oscillospiraceae bacterium]